MIKSRVAERYAKSLLEMATEDDIVAEVEGDFHTVREAIAGSRDLRNFLATPIIDDHRKESILTEIFATRVSPLVGRFISLMARKGRASQLPDIVEAFEDLLDRVRQITPAEITTAVVLDPEQRARLEAHLTTMSGGSLRPVYRVDPELIGGFRARFQDRMVDASVRHQLERLRESLISGRN
jgi:F-type H+-transporting ATPase subunit delta